MSEVETMTETVVSEPKERKYTPLTDEQKKAATFRRDAALLRKYGNEAKAAELEAQADKIAPVRAQATRDDPMQLLTEEEQKKLRTSYFETTKQGFSKIAALVSYKKLAAIAAEIK